MAKKRYWWSSDYSFKKSKKYDRLEWNKFAEDDRFAGYTALYKPLTLDFSYVEKMANAFAARFNISVEASSFWSVDIKAKKLTYNPQDLIMKEKAEVIGLLLHEIGHLRHTTVYKYNEFTSFYPRTTQFVINAFEDLRINNIMASSYEGARDIFDVLKENTAAISATYQMQARRWEENFVHLFLEGSYELECAVLNINKCVKDPVVRAGDPFFKNEYALQKRETTEAYKKRITAQWIEWAKERAYSNSISSTSFKPLVAVLKSFPKDGSIEDLEKFYAAKVEELKKTLAEKNTLYDYMAAITFYGYGDIEYLKTISAPLLARVNATLPALEKIKIAENTQAVVDILAAEVFPVIKDLLQEETQNHTAFTKILGEKNIMAKAAHNPWQIWNYQPQDKNEITPQILKDGSGRGNSVPKEWADGDYKALYDSVKTPIQELKRKLNFLRTKSMAPRYEYNHRRGRLDLKALRRFPAGSMRLFKKKFLMRDEMKDFAFSLMVDVSGSMSDEDHSIDAARSTILLSEVLNDLKIPFEVISFGAVADKLKRFDQPLDRNAKLWIGKIAKANQGSTNFFTLFKGKDGTNLLKQPQTRKIGVVLSDGGLDSRDFDEYNPIFKAWRKDKTANMIGIGINCGNELEDLCGGEHSFSIENTLTLPDKFAKILKATLSPKKAGTG